MDGRGGGRCPPYVTTLEALDEDDCDFCVHGDDITLTAEGVDTYHLVRKANRYKEVSRAAGVSTTDLVGRMLFMPRTRNHFKQGDQEYSVEKDGSSMLGQDHSARSLGPDDHSSYQPPRRSFSSATENRPNFRRVANMTIPECIRTAGVQDDRGTERVPDYTCCLSTSSRRSTDCWR